MQHLFILGPGPKIICYGDFDLNQSAIIAATIIGSLMLLGLLVYIYLERGLLPRQSTRDFWSLSTMPWYKKLEGYIYGSRAEWYLKPATWKWVHRLTSLWGEETGNTYHSKVLVLDDARKLVRLNRPVEFRRMDHVLPYPIARDLILSGPGQKIAVFECPCRANSPNPCLPVDVCLAVGEPFASFIVEHNPGKARFISCEEAVDIVEAEEKRGHIHTAWFKDAMHDRFYALCNCCGCCCLGMQSFKRGVPRLTHSGYMPVLTESEMECNGCGLCVKKCLFKAIGIEGDDNCASLQTDIDQCECHLLAPGKNIKVRIDPDLCMGCGGCVSLCPRNALELQRDPARLMPMNLEWLVSGEPASEAD